MSFWGYIHHTCDRHTDRQTDKKHLLTHTQEGLTNDRNITASTAAIAIGAVVNCTARFTDGTILPQDYLKFIVRSTDDSDLQQCKEILRFGWRRGVVVSGVRRMNDVNARRARLLPGWVTVFGRVYHLGM